MLDLSPDELLTTTRSVRLRLDLSRPVARPLIEECLEIAQQAPSGGNQQGWSFVVVTDAEKRHALAALYKKSWDVYLQEVAARADGADPRQVGADQAPRLAEAMAGRARGLRAEEDGPAPIGVAPGQQRLERRQAGPPISQALGVEAHEGDAPIGREGRHGIQDGSQLGLGRPPAGAGAPPHGAGSARVLRPSARAGPARSATWTSR